MKFLSNALLCILFATAVLAQNDGSTSNSTTDLTTESTTISNPTTSSTAVPTDTPTTADTPTTTETPTTSETTTSTGAPTPTETPTTTEVPTTTEAPSSSTGAPSTTKAPEPPSTLPDCAWNVTQNNVTCIRVELKAFFTIPIANRTEYITLNPNSTIDGSDCHLSNDTQKLVLTEANHYTLTLIFTKEGGKVFVNETIFEYILPEGTGSASSNSKLFSVKAGNSYLCNSKDSLKLENVTMKYQDVHVQAFGESGNTGFTTADECDSDDKVSDAIPIAVGCALAALILVVLIAYLVGRRQSRQRGYQSV